MSKMVAVNLLVRIEITCVNQITYFDLALILYVWKKRVLLIIDIRYFERFELIIEKRGYVKSKYMEYMIGLTSGMQVCYVR